MTNNFTNSRRDLRERAFQALFSLEFGGEYLQAAEFAYTYDKTVEEDEEVQVPYFTMRQVTASTVHAHSSVRWFVVVTLVLSLVRDSTSTMQTAQRHL